MNDIVVNVPQPPTPPAPTPAPTPNPAPGPTNVRKPWLKQHWKWLTLVISLILIGGSVYAWSVLRPLPEPKATLVTKATPKPTPSPTPLQKASPLTGVMVDTALADRPVSSVIIENSPEARPQSGLSDAGVVYEALAEGGITRYQTFFLEGQPKSLGPVRSLRPYFVDWGVEFNAPVAHAGGSAEALNLAGPAGLKTLNALAIGAPTFYRTSDRLAPHNLYTTAALMDKLLTSRGLAKSATFTPSPRQKDAPLQTADHPSIHIDFSYALFSVDYTYDPVQNNYLRKLAGVPHLDRNTGTQIRVKNIVVEYTPVSVQDSAGHMKIQTIGSGKAIVFRDGTAITGTWNKSARDARTKLLDAAGKEIPLNTGNTWYSIVPTDKPVRY